MGCWVQRKTAEIPAGRFCSGTISLGFGLVVVGAGFVIFGSELDSRGWKGGKEVCCCCVARRVQRSRLTEQMGS